MCLGDFGREFERLEVEIVSRK